MRPRHGGPRQSGKTTLCRQLFPEKPYVSLEALDQRAFAFRDHQGHEVDLLVERGDNVAAVEIKSGQTISSDFFDDLAWLARQDLGPRRLPLTPVLVYAGQERQSRTQALVVPWFAVHESPW